MSRRFFVSGLTSIFDHLADFDPRSFKHSLALHSSPLLARFEQTFNSLLTRLRENETELSVWIYREAERSRFRALGEISALVTHDLGTPIHVLQFCADQLHENPELIFRDNYRSQLRTQATHASDLIGTLRASLRNTAGDKQLSNLGEAHRYVRRLLSFSYSDVDLGAIRFEVDEHSYALSVPIKMADLIHILNNLYSNSVQNFLQSDIQDGLIEVRGILDDQKVVLSIRDNGTGLARERYEAMTAYRFHPGNLSAAGEGLGLRLTRRLVERYGGALEVIEGQSIAPFKKPGTTFRLTLCHYASLQTAAAVSTQPGEL